MSKYKITLEPMGAFFFGGERSFSISTKDKNGKYSDPEDNWSSYIVESNIFPQQTALLGMLRFTLLKNSNCFDLSKNEFTVNGKEIAKSLIGATGFQVSGKKNEFGVIDSISPCYIEHKGKLLKPTPLDYGLTVKFENAVSAVYNSKDVKVPYIKDKKGKKYSGKSERDSGFLYLNNGEFVKSDDIFVKDQRIGINRDIKTGKTDDNALFKQVFYRLNDNYKFCFYATITDDSVIPTVKTVVELGGDSSKFAITFTKLKEGETEPENTNPDKVTKSLYEGTKCSDRPSVVLLSGTYVEAEDYIFAISENTPFTFLVSSVEKTTQYNRMPQTMENPKPANYLHKSERYSLFKRGSVFYFDDDGNADSFKKAIESKKDFVQIGYNKCKVNK